MPVAERLLIDTNVLLEATDAKRAQHDDAKELIESRRGLVVPAQVIRIEWTWNVTRRRAGQRARVSSSDSSSPGNQAVVAHSPTALGHGSL
jgi:predicted nucleic acid-binding protein